MRFGGVATVVVDMLAVLGRRVNSLSVRSLPRRRRRALAPVGAGAWPRIADSVMRRPLTYVAVIVVGLLLLGAPFLRIAWGGIGERVLPAGSQSRQAAETLARDFPGNATSPIDAVVRLPNPIGDPTRDPALSAYLGRLEDVPGVTGAAVTAAHGRTARVSVSHEGAPVSSAARDVVRRVRHVSPPPGGRCSWAG